MKALIVPVCASKRSNHMQVHLKSTFTIIYPENALPS